MGKQTVKRRRWYSWLFLGMFILGIVAALYFKVFLAPRAKQAEQELEREFASIALFPQATPTNSQKSYKDSQALVVIRYSTPAEYQTVREYYDSELPKHGWRFVSEQTNLDWGRDLGGKTAHYCKGDWSANVEYIGRDGKGIGNYSLALSWGLDDCR